MEMPTVHDIGDIFHFMSTEFWVVCTIAVFECKISIFQRVNYFFDIFEHRVLGGLFRAVFSVQSAFSECRYLIFSMKLPFSERGILEGLIIDLFTIIP